MFIAHAEFTYRPGIYAFHSIMSMHICSNSSNISSNWHDLHKYAGLLVHGRKCCWCVLTRHHEAIVH